MMHKIYGIMLRPVCFSKEEFEQVWSSGKHSVTSNFYDAYRELKVGMEQIAEYAKLYIENNYQKVTDWSDLDIKIGEDVYYTFKGTIRKASKLKNYKKYQEERQANQNPVVSITNVVLDYSDGDFFITINGKEYSRIDNDTVILIAECIENQLKNK